MIQIRRKSEDRQEMTALAQIIDGKQISAQIKEELREEAAAYKARGIEAALAVIQVGEDPASSIYVRRPRRRCWH